MEEILQQLIGSLSDYSEGVLSSEVVQDFLHQQYPIGSKVKNGHIQWEM